MFKKILLATFTATISLSTAASAEQQLLCASTRDQSLYFTSGQIRVTADIVSSVFLERISLSTTGSDALGFNVEESQGSTSGRYVRFSEADAWCNYRLTLPTGFANRERATLFLDAYCEENNNYTIRLNCAIR